MPATTTYWPSASRLPQSPKDNNAAEPIKATPRAPNDIMPNTTAVVRIIAIVLDLYGGAQGGRILQLTTDGTRERLVAGTGLAYRWGHILPREKEGRGVALFVFAVCAVLYVFTTTINSLLVVFCRFSLVTWYYFIRDMTQLLRFTHFLELFSSQAASGRACLPRRMEPVGWWLPWMIVPGSTGRFYIVIITCTETTEPSWSG